MREQEKHFAVVNGIGFGEETKGNTVQALVRELKAHTVWRSGGWQGGHHITHDDGREIALSHFGAGIFEGAETYLKHMVISPVELFQEAIEIENLGIPNPLNHIVIDENCLATTPFHSGISRTREILRGKNKKGTIGKGVGEAIKDSVNPELTIRAGEFSDRQTILRKVENIRKAKLNIAKRLLSNYVGTPPEEVYSELKVLEDQDLVNIVTDSFKYISDLVNISDGNHLETLLDRPGSIVNEVSHGALHHPRYGFIPHVTQIDPTSKDVLTTVKSNNYDGNAFRIGVVRSYLTRHGAGPFVSFDQKLTNTLVETHNNAANEWLGTFRAGYFDIVALKYALSISGGKNAFSGIFVSYMDAISQRKDWKVVEAYEYHSKADDLEKFFNVKEGKITGIKIHPDTNQQEHYQHQLRLTKLLNDCSVVTSTLTSTKKQTLEQVFLQYVTKELGVPVVGIAYGPKVTDRYFLPQWQNVLKKED